MNIWINVRGGGHEAKKILFHFSLNHGILSRMALYFGKVGHFFLFSDPFHPYWKILTFFFFEPFTKNILLRTTTQITMDIIIKANF